MIGLGVGTRDGMTAAGVYVAIYVGMTMGAITLMGEEDRVVGLMGEGGLIR